MTNPTDPSPWEIWSLLIFIGAAVWLLVQSRMRAYDRNESAKLQYRINQRERERRSSGK